MQVARDGRLQIPEELRQKLLAFRRRVWLLKMFEAVAAALIGVLLGFLLTYLLDRLFDTPPALRMLIFAGAVLTCGAIPAAIDRWVWRRRRLDQLARLLAETHPAAGDQLLGVIELASDKAEQSRSPELVQAAIRQVAEHVGRQDLRGAIPRPQHKQRGIAAAVLVTAAVLLLCFTASAATNAWARFLAPWKATERYTFAAIEPLPKRLVVPHGEPFPLSIELQASTQWQPSTARVSLAGSPPQQAPLSEESYQFRLPGQISPGTLDVRVGDFQGHAEVLPMLRPELSSLQAEIALPAYLGRSEAVTKEVRGGTLSLVKGSQATLTATASRELARATVNGQDCAPQANRFSIGAIPVEQSTKIELAWQDPFGMSGQKPFQLSIEALDDQSPHWSVRTCRSRRCCSIARCCRFKSALTTILASSWSASSGGDWTTAPASGRAASG
jgi:hypothetical protein